MTTAEDLLALDLTFHKMHTDGGIADDTFWKLEASLASEFACRFLDIERALRILHVCPPSYFGQALFLQMQQDSLFAAAMVELVYRLNQLGTAGVLQSLNMPPAEA
jgi:hypothetical protein